MVIPFLIWTIVVLAIEMTRRVFRAESILLATAKPGTYPNSNATAFSRQAILLITGIFAAFCVLVFAWMMASDRSSEEMPSAPQALIETSTAESIPGN